jgi:hypothetical protein
MPIPPAKSASPGPGAAAPNPPAAATEPLIAGRYAVDLSRPLPAAGGGLPAYAVTDRRDSRAGLMAVQVAPGAPPRLTIFTALSELADPRMLVPLAYGAVPGAERRPQWFVVCTAPPGPPLWPADAAAIRPWAEAELVARVMRPAAAVLEVLQEQRMTHRGIRPNNLFLDPTRNGPVVLGCAWAGPPAMAQPALFEPPYMAMCAPAARGAGEIADDVYALGVTMLCLALGRIPHADLETDALVRRKLELGCFQALAGDAKLSPMIADLTSGMLAQHPEHRPTPALLADPSAARARRVAARPPRRAPHALEVSDISVFDSRSLAFAVARQPEVGARLVRTGVADHWLRRVLGDTALAGKVEDIQRVRNAEGGPADTMADARLVLQTVALLDPLAPLCWRGIALWPDAIGSALVTEPIDVTTRGRIEEVIAQEIPFTWGLARAERCNPLQLRQEAKDQRTLLRMRGWAGGLQRVDYALNPLLPCRSKVLADHPVARMRDLLLSLEAISGREELRTMPPIDRDMAAFIAAHTDGRFDKQISALGDAADPEEAVVEQLAVLADLQKGFKAPPLPGLAAWIAELMGPELRGWHNKATQAARRQALDLAVPAGDLAALHALMKDKPAREADERGFTAAREAVRRLDVRIARLRNSSDARTETSTRLGQESAAVLGLTSLVASLIAALLA